MNGIRLGGVALGLVLAVCIVRVSPQAAAGLTVVVVTLIGMAHVHRLPVWGRYALVAFILCAGALFAKHDFTVVLRRIRVPPEFDVLQFWLHARVALQGLNFYESEHALALARSMSASPALLNELYFWYPPPTMLLFAWLGLLPLQAAAACWYTAILAAALVDIFLLWKVFLREEGWLGLLLSATLLITFAPVAMTLGYGQLNFFTLLALLLFWRDRERPRAGLWLGLAVLTKPFAAIVALYPLAQGKARVLAVAVTTWGGLLTTTAVAFGLNTVTSYWTLGPRTHMDHATIPDATSVPGLIWRLSQGTLTNIEIVWHPVYLLAAAVTVGITLWLAIKARDSQRHELALAATVPLGLLLYPATGAHYAVSLLPTFLVMWKTRLHVPAETIMKVLFLGGEYVLFSLYSFDHPEYAVAGVGLPWLIVMLAMLFAFPHPAVAVPPTPCGSLAGVARDVEERGLE